MALQLEGLRNLRAQEMAIGWRVRSERQARGGGTSGGSERFSGLLWTATLTGVVTRPVARATAVGGRASGPITSMSIEPNSSWARCI
jgi:hypothetical protein